MTAFKSVESIRYYACGYCTNDLHTVFRGYPHEKRQFPAGVFLIRHVKEGYILFDTGYSSEISTLGFQGRLYHLLNPTVVRPADEIQNQLMADGIQPEEIRYLFLSHLHPDHIGCVKHFKSARIVLSRDAFLRYRRNRLGDLIFQRLLPPWFAAHCTVLRREQLREEKNAYFSYCDFFRDGSLLLTQMDGHARGQLCCLIENKIFLGADASWGNEFVGRANELRFLARLVQYDMRAYRENDRILSRMRSDDIRLCFSHDRGIEDVIKE